MNCILCMGLPDILMALMERSSTPAGVGASVARLTGGIGRVRPQPPANFRDPSGVEQRRLRRLTTENARTRLKSALAERQPVAHERRQAEFKVHVGIERFFLRLFGVEKRRRAARAQVQPRRPHHNIDGPRFFSRLCCAKHDDYAGSQPSQFSSEFIRIYLWFHRNLIGMCRFGSRTDSRFSTCCGF